MLVIRTVSMEQSQQPPSVVELIGTLKDGERGYTAAAEAARNPRIKSLFGDYARQRSRFLEQLTEAVRRCGASEPLIIRGAAGAFHRVWITFRTMLSRGDDRAILSECERGEESALHHYEKALRDRLSSSIRDIVMRQYDEVKNAHDRIHHLRTITKTV